jgi:dTDP-4-amino-4,6-dideoxygalactose transaminase
LTALKGKDGIIPLRPTSQGKSAWHAFVVRSPFREKMIQALNRKKIGHQIYYPAALPSIKLFRKFSKGRYPVAEELARTAVALPLHSGLEAGEIATIENFLISAR